MVVVVFGFGVLFDEVIDVEALGAAAVPGPVEHGDGLVILGTADIRIGKGLTAEAVGEHPGIGHDLVGIDEGVGGRRIGGGRGMVAVDAVHDATDRKEGLDGGFRKIDLHPPIGAGFLTVDVAVAVGYLHVAGKDADGAADIGDAEEVLPGGLFVEGELIEGVIPEGIE